MRCEGRISLVILDNRRKYDQRRPVASPSVRPQSVKTRGEYESWEQESISTNFECTGSFT